MVGYFPLIREGSTTHMHGLAIYRKERLHFARELFQENSADSYTCFGWLYFTQCVTSFCFIDHLCLYARFFDSILYNIAKVFSINPSADVFVFGEFNAHHNDCLTDSGGTDRPGELCYNCSISNGLTQMVNVPTQIPDCDSHRPAFLFFSFLCC